jgi:hypothetical protein
MKTNKKAQISFFIVIGIVLILLIAFFYILAEGLPKGLRSEEYNVQSIAENCLKQVSQDSIIVFGKQGGKIELEQPYFEPLQTSYLLLNGTNRVPTIEQAEQELAVYVEQNLNLCIKDFDALKSQGITVKEVSKPDVKVVIAEKNVIFRLDYPLKETKGSTETTYSEFSPHSEELRLKPILETAEKIVQSEIGNDGKIDLSIETPNNVIFFPYTKKLVAVIEDPSYSINGKPYKFVFAQD